MNVCEIFASMLFLSVIYTLQASITYHLLGLNKKPSSNIHSYRVESVEFQEQCFAKCHYDISCYSVAIVKDNPTCWVYNKTVPHEKLVTSPNTEYYTDVRSCYDWYNLGAVHSGLYQVNSQGKIIDINCNMNVSSFQDCYDWYVFGAKESGVYTVNWMGRMMKDVRCNMEIDGGGWLTFQRRFDGSVDFLSPGTWAVYKHGFGSPEGEFWLGNDFLHEITSSDDYNVLLSAESFSGETRESKYGYFRIQDENDNYRLYFVPSTIKGTHSFYNSGASNMRNMQFTTIDRDNDAYGSNCYSSGGLNRGPSWFRACSKLWMNGKYGIDASDSDCGFLWKQFTSSDCLKSMEIMIRKMSQPNAP